MNSDASTQAELQVDSAAVEPSFRAARLVRFGTACWMLVGIALFGSFVITVASTLSGVLVPLIVATVVGALAVPLVDKLEVRRVPRWVGALVVILSFIVVVVISTVITARGIVDQSDAISRSVTSGLDRVNGWLAENSVDAGTSDEQLDQLAGFQGLALTGLASYFGTIFSGVVALGFGIFLSGFMLFYVLTDWERLRDWVGGHLGVSAELGSGVLDDSISVVRLGFAALTTSSLVTAVIIGAAMVVLDLPLAFTVALVTFVTSYVPYLGAIFSGAFGFLIALGSGGLGDAITLLIVILVVQNLLQTIIGNRLTSTTLAIHPLAGLIATIIGAAAFGFLGGMLSAPFLAVSIRIAQRFRESKSVAIAVAAQAL